MKRLTAKILTISLLILFSACKSYNLYNDKNTNYGQPKKVVVAKFKGGVVTLEDVNLELKRLIPDNAKDLSFSDLDEDQQKVVIKEIIAKKLILIEAKKRKLDKGQDYQKSIQAFQDELLKQIFISKLTKDVVKEDNLKKRYDELVEGMKTKQDIKIRYIVLEEEKEADKLYKILKKSPGSFSYYAKKKSIDKTTAKKGGRLGDYVLRDQLPTPIANYTLNMKKYEISKPIQVGSNWFLIKLDDERPAKIRSFADSKEALSKNLAKKKLVDFTQEHIEKSQIEFFLY